MHPEFTSSPASNPHHPGHSGIGSVMRRVCRFPGGNRSWEHPTSGVALFTPRLPYFPHHQFSWWSYFRTERGFGKKDQCTMRIKGGTKPLHLVCHFSCSSFSRVTDKPIQLDSSSTIHNLFSKPLIELLK